MAAVALHVHVADKDRNLAEKTLRSIGSGRPLLAHDETGSPFELSGPLLATIREVLSRALESDEYMLVNRESEMTPEEAAKVLGISRPMVYLRMDTGRLPFKEVGTHRRILLKDVLALKDAEADRRRFTKAFGEDTDAQEPEFSAS